MAIKKSFYTTGKNKTREFILYQLTHSRLRNSRLVTRALQFCLVIILNIPTDWKEVQRYFGYFRSKKLSCSWLDIIRSCFSYGSTIEEYFVFYFCKREPRERASYITESIRHCVSKQLNMPFIDLMRDKFQFHQQFERFMQREAVLLNSSSDFAVLDAYCKRQGRFVKIGRAHV